MARLLSVMAFTVAKGRISDIEAVNGPATLAAIDLPDPL
jgi:hypothetical protein